MEKVIIMDIGPDKSINNLATGEKLNIPRFGVWSEGNVIEVGDDLEQFNSKYQVIDIVQI